MKDTDYTQEIVQDYSSPDVEVYNRVFEPTLYRSLCVPSMVHNYSLAIEYMKNWFLNRIPDYYKSVYVNGSHLFIDYKAFNADYSERKKEKPKLAIVPEIDTEYDRDTLDTYFLPNTVLPIRHNANKNNIFIIDREHNIQVGIGFEQMLMNFAFRSQVSTQAQQLDLWKYMEMALRVGANQYEYINADIHIPTEIILNIAELAGFELIYGYAEKLDMSDDSTEAPRKVPTSIKNITAFMKYINKVSSIPIIYKFRSITGRPEFFARVPNILMHISSSERLQLDQGEMEGKVRTNFNIDFQCRLLMTIPKYYFMTYATPTAIMIPKIEADVLGILNMKIITIPEIDENGWQRFLKTQYQEETLPKEYPHKIEGIDELLGDPDVSTVIDYCKNNGLSPSIFLKFVFLNDENKSNIRVDWSTYTLYVYDKMTSINSYIAIYKDNEFINNTLINIKNMNKKRIE